MRFFFTDHAEDEYTIACLLFVFVAVSIPKLARMDLSNMRASLEGKLRKQGVVKISSMHSYIKPCVVLTVRM